jgi:hypothetical protein
MNIRFLTLAQKEVDESVRWYDEQASLGRDFLAITCHAFSVKSGALPHGRASAPAITRLRLTHLPGSLQHQS